MSISNKTVFSLLKSYFNLYNEQLEIKPKNISIRRLSSHKIFVSKGEFKHTNNKVIINMFVYNRQKLNLLKQYSRISKSLKRSKNKKFNKINKNALFLINNAKIYKIKMSCMKNKLVNNKFNYYENLYRNDYIIACYEREMLYLSYKRLLLLNKLKFRYTYIQIIINIIKKIFNKDVDFNLINLKYFYLNSDIYTESILNKITKNRKKHSLILKLAVHKARVVNNRKMQLLDQENKFNKLSLINSIDMDKIKKSYFSNENLDLGELLVKIFSKSNKKFKIKKVIMDSINNKNITGVRVEASGRLTRRFTASRSLFKLKYKGNLRNRNSSYRGLSSVIMRGNLRSNLQYTKLNSIVRIGSYGLKG